MGACWRGFPQLPFHFIELPAETPASEDGGQDADEPEKRS